MTDPTDLAAELYNQSLETSGPEALRLANEALAIFLEHCGENHPDVANVLTGIATLSPPKEAETHAARAVDIWRAIAPLMEPADAQAIGVEALSAHGDALRELGRYGEAEGPLREAYDLAKDARTANNLGVLYKFWGKFDDAAKLYAFAVEQTGAEDSDMLATLQHNIGGLAHARGDFAAGEEPARKAGEIRARLKGDDHVETAADFAAYAAVLDGLGRFDESRPLYAKALAVFESHFGRRHYEIAVNLHNLANVEWNEGEKQKARKLFEEALSIKREVLGAGHPDTALTQHSFAILLKELGETEKSRTLLGEALAVFQSRLGTNHPHTMACAEALDCE